MCGGRRARAWIGLGLGICLGGTGLRAQDVDLRRSPPAARAMVEPAASSVGTEFLTEGFEGAFPPAGWTVTGQPGLTVPHRWHLTADSTYVRSGGGAALVQWQSTLPQDEMLTTAAVDLSAASPSGLRAEIWWYGNPFWAPNADLEVQASSDAASWTQLWTMSGAGGTGWAWRSAVLDVGAWAGGTLYLRFRYVGIDGADLALDDVRVGYLESPVPPPNDDCAGAAGDPAYVVSQVGPFTLGGDNSRATSNYPLAMPGSCTGYTHTGRDLVWAVDVPPQHDVVATMTTVGGWDDTLFLLGDCADPAGTCLAGDNALPDGSTVHWTNGGVAARRVYLVASGYAQGAGAFTVTGAVQPTSAVSASSWGRVKARYR